jgi:hypothetical protein
MHLFYGLRIGENFCVQAQGDTLRGRGVAWHLYHYPNGFDGDCHPSGEFSRYDEAIRAAERGECADCAVDAGEARGEVREAMKGR